MDELRNIVKDSLRAAFYKKKPLHERFFTEQELEEMAENVGFIGVVDGWGGMHAKPLKRIDHTSHHEFFPFVSGDRWVYRDGKIIWSNNPSDDSMFEVEDYLFKHGEKPVGHYAMSSSSKIRNVDEVKLEAKEIKFTTNLSESSNAILQESLRRFFTETINELESWMD